MELEEAVEGDTITGLAGPLIHRVGCIYTGLEIPTSCQHLGERLSSPLVGGTHLY